MFTTSPIGSKQRAMSQLYPRRVEMPSRAINLQPTNVNPVPDSDHQVPSDTFEQDNSFSDESDIFIDDSEEPEDEIVFSAEESARLNEDFHHLSFQQSETSEEQESASDLPPPKPRFPIPKSERRVTFQDREPIQYRVEDASEEEESFTFAQDFTASVGLKATQLSHIFLKFLQEIFSFRTMLLISIPIVVSFIYSNAGQIPLPSLSWPSKDSMSLFSEKFTYTNDPEKKLAMFLEKSENQLKQETEELVKSLRSELEKRTEELNYDVSSLLHIIEEQRNILEERRLSSEKNLPETGVPIDVVVSHSDLTDYAKTSAGASIDKSLTSRCYMPSQWDSWTIWKFIRRAYGFRTFGCMPAKTILSDEPTESGVYWPLRGSSGQVTIELPLVLSLDSFGLSFPVHHKLDNQGMAPKDIRIWASVTNSDMRKRVTDAIPQNSKKQGIPTDFVELMDFKYDVTSSDVYQFKQFPQEVAQTPIKKIMIQILSNWGESEATALYRVEILGKPFANNVSTNSGFHKDFPTRDSSHEQTLGSDEDMTL